MKVNIWTDGAAMKKPNPGPAGAGYIIEGDAVRCEGKKPLGNATNNEAEYLAIIRALAVAREMGAVQAHLSTDSNVVYGHLELGHKCNYEHLRLLLAKIREERGRYPGGVSFECIDRSLNREADALAKAAKVMAAAGLTIEERRTFPKSNPGKS